MTGKLTKAVVLVLAVCAIIWVATYVVRDQRALKRQIATLQHANDSLKAAERALDTVYLAKTDTLRLTRHVTDSILATDTVIKTVVVQKIVERERRACDALVATCEEQKANLRAQIGNVQQQLDLEKKRRPGHFGCAGPAVASTQGAGLGVGCGLLIHF